MPEVQIDNVYDLLAWLCAIIAALPLDEQQSLTREYELAQKTRLIEREFDFFDMKGPDKEKTYEFLSREQIKVICEKVNHWRQTNSAKVYILYLLTYLAGYFDFDKAFAHFLTDKLCEEVAVETWSFVALNSNYDEVGGALIPKFKPIWEKKNIRTPQELNCSPFALLTNYLWIPIKFGEEEWKVTHFYFSKRAIAIYKNEPLIVIASPGQRENTFSYHCDEEIKRFIIDRYNGEACGRLQDKIKQVLESAARQNAHIVLFPEMLGTIEIQENICQYLSESNNEYPALICLPSTEFSISKERRTYCNTTFVINGSGEKIAEYHKQHPFCLDGESKTKTDEKGNPSIVHYYEPIKPDWKINIFHVEGVGRIGLVICADVFHEEMVDYLFRVLQVNVLLVMAYTKGTDAFFRALDMASNAYCDVIWCNACASYEKPTEENPVVVYFSFGHKQQRRYYCKYCGKSEDKCGSCMAVIKIAAEYRRAEEPDFIPF